MTFLKDFDWSFKSIIKALGVLALGIVAIGLIVGVIGFAFSSLSGNRLVNQSVDRVEGLLGGEAGYDDYYEEVDFALAERAYPGDLGATSVSSLSYPSPPLVPPSTGSDAEAFEIKNYSGTIATRRLNETCDRIAELKEREDVIFEHSDKNEDNCHYRFKVEKARDQEMVELIESLDPEYFNANIQSIKANIESVESELEILTKKLTSVEETLENAQQSYDEISQIATEQQDAASLTAIIDSKLNLIERLTSERLSIKERIDRYNQSRANQLDQLNYTFFNINVYKDVIVDWEQIRDNWKFEAKQFIQNINDVFQGLTLNLVYFLFGVAQVVLYLFISVFVFRWVWKGIKWIWKGNNERK